MACFSFCATTKLQCSPTGLSSPDNTIRRLTSAGQRLDVKAKGAAAKVLWPRTWGGDGGGGAGGNSGRGGGDGWHREDEDDDDDGQGEGGGWSWQWLALSLLAVGGSACIRAAPSFAIVLETSTRQTYVGEYAEKYAEALRQLCEENGYEFYGTPYKLNIVGARNPTDEPGAFDDHFSVVYATDGEGGKPSGWVVSTYTASVDPGRAWLTLGWGGPGGTAILCPGQYVDAYEVGNHNGKYEALLQGRPVKVWRDYDRDGKLDFGEHGSFDDEGLFGVNIHHAGIKDSEEYHVLLTKYTDMVEKYSAGCQVIATVDDFNHFMETVRMSVRNGNKPFFTYTLFQGEHNWDAISAPLQQARESLQPYLT